MFNYNSINYESSNILLDSRPLNDIEKAYFSTGTDVNRLKRVKLQLEIELLMMELKRKKQQDHPDNEPGTRLRKVVIDQEITNALPFNIIICSHIISAN